MKGVLMAFILLPLFSMSQKNIIKNEKAVEIKSDTLIVKSPNIKYILVDGVVYEIVRSVEIKKSEKEQNFYTPFWQGKEFLTIDTSAFIRSGFNYIKK